jgi:hypothetical protein
MITRNARGRSGVTLTEILISILILGVGMVSLLTLFPLGLLRLRTATRLSRSTYLTESAESDISMRNLLAKFTFITPLQNTTQALSPTPYVTTPNGLYDPWVQDTPAYGQDWNGGGLNFGGMYRGVGGAGQYGLGSNWTYANLIGGPGLPVAYDPLWRAQLVANWPYQANATLPTLDPRGEARFGAGISTGNNGGLTYLRSPANGLPSAHGLQRITNFFPGNAQSTPALALSTPQAYAIEEAFVSPEDLVFQDPKSQYVARPDPNIAALSFPGVSNPSPIVPDLSQVSGAGSATPTSTTTTVYKPVRDWRYTWMFTGQQTDALNGTVFDGSVVVFENRQFGFDLVPSPFGGGSANMPAGETVVEAVWGAGSNVVNGYPRNAKRIVLLRWPSAMADPDVKVGQWIADVTYERKFSVSNARYPANALYPGQRCYWYQIAKRTEPGPDPSLANYRSLTVWTSSDLRALSQLNPNGTPVNVEAALIAPSVVNVIPRTIYTR